MTSGVETRPTNRWAGLAGAVVLAVGLGLVTQNRVVLLAAAVPLVVLLAGRLATPPAPDVAVSRSLARTRPALGREVDVTVTVENDGAAIADLRVRDGVPDALPVVDGSPAAAIRLDAGEAREFVYTVRARRGTHRFEGVALAASGTRGTRTTTESRDVSSTVRVRAAGTPGEARAPAAGRPAGSRSAETGGGVEFYGIREYRPGDPRARVDWRRFARTGELYTVEFREDRTATVALVVDLRPAGDVALSPGGPTANEYAVHAAEAAFETLSAAGARVSLHLLPDAPDALSPGSGRDHRTRARRFFDAHGPGVDGVAPPTHDGGAGASTPDATARTPAATDGGGTAADPDVGALASALPGTGRAVVFSPLLDDRTTDIVNLARREANDVRVVSKGFEAGTTGARVAAVERADRVAALRSKRVGVVDWAGEPLPTVLDRVLGGSA